MARRMCAAYASPAAAIAPRRLLIFPLCAKERKKENLYLNLNLNLYLYLGALHALHTALHSVTSGVTVALHHARRSPFAAEAVRRLPISLCAKEREKEALSLYLYLDLNLYLYLYLEASQASHANVTSVTPKRHIASHKRHICVASACRKVKIECPSWLHRQRARIQCRCFRLHPSSL